MTRALPLYASFLLAVGLLGAPAAAKEESKIQVPLESLGGLPGASADLRSKLDGGGATLQLRAKGLAASTEYLVLTDGIEQARFMSEANGHANVTFDLLEADAASPRIPFDPRGRYVTVNDGVQDVLGAWYSTTGEPDRTKVKEWTDLSPEPVAASGQADARYDRRPNGKASFRVHMRHAPDGVYDVVVADVVVGSIDTNGSGGGRIDFTTKGKGKKGMLLDFDPRGELVELEQGGALYFSGIMLAQIDGLNVCTASEETVPLTVAPGEGSSGSATLAVEEDCDLELRVEMTGLMAEDHEVRVDGALLMGFAADGSDSLVLDTNPDDVSEAVLGLDPSGGLLEVVRVSDSLAVLSATLP
jgi:hypothetical protein